jgi:surface antigen
MRRSLLSAGLGLLCLAAPAAIAGQPGDAGTGATELEQDAPPAATAPETPREQYEREVRAAEEARREYEEAVERRRQEIERAQADYRQRLEEYEADPAVQRARANSCESQIAVHRDRSGRIGRFLGRVVGGVAGQGAGTDFENWVIRTGTMVGTRIANLLDCGEQVQVAAATEEALEGGVGTTVTWTSETRENVSGSSTVIAAEEQEGGGQCMTVTDIVIIEGEETRAPKRMCRIPPSTRFVRV